MTGFDDDSVLKEQTPALELTEDLYEHPPRLQTTCDTFPKELKKKVTLLEHFKKYLVRRNGRMQLSLGG